MYEERISLLRDMNFFTQGLRMRFVFGSVENILKVDLVGDASLLYGVLVMNYLRKQVASRKAFTLIELLVVIAIIGVLVRQYNRRERLREEVFVRITRSS